jgi:hypothetical protein
MHGWCGGEDVEPGWAEDDSDSGLKRGMQVWKKMEVEGERNL